MRRAATSNRLVAARDWARAGVVAARGPIDFVGCKATRSAGSASPAAAAVRRTVTAAAAATEGWPAAGIVVGVASVTLVVSCRLEDGALSGIPFACVVSGVLACGSACASAGRADGAMLSEAVLRVVVTLAAATEAAGPTLLSASDGDD